jgi:hypothetical protein
MPDHPCEVAAGPCIATAMRDGNVCKLEMQTNAWWRSNDFRVQSVLLCDITKQVMPHQALSDAEQRWNPRCKAQKLASLMLIFARTHPLYPKLGGAIWRYRAGPEYREMHYREKQSSTLVDKYQKAGDTLSVVDTYWVVSPSAAKAVAPATLFLYAGGAA